MNKTLRKLMLYLMIIFAAFSIMMGIGLQNDFTYAENAKIDKITLTVDVGSYSIEDMPKALEGETYPVFPYSAFDNLGNNIKNVDVLVYFDTNSDSNHGQLSDDKLLNINDGRFKTEKVGQYVIEYTATYKEIRETIRLYITALEKSEYEPCNYIINDKLVDSVYTGSKVYLYKGETVSDWRFGIPEVNVDVSYQGDYEVDDIEIVKTIGIENYFKPVAKGIYKISYTVSNILGKNSEVITTHEVVVDDSDVPVLVAPSLPSVLHVGKSVQLPLTEAIQYYNGQKLYVPVKVSVDGELLTDDRIFTPTVAGSVEVTYSAASILNSANIAMYKETISIYDLAEADDDNIYLSKYLHLDGFVGEYKYKDDSFDDEAYVVTAVDNVDCASVTFGRAIIEDFIKTEFAVVQTLASFNNICFILKDSEDASEVVELRLEEMEQYVQVYLNGREVYRFTDKCFGECDNNERDASFVFEYDKNNMSFMTSGDKTICRIDSFVDGSTFNGFTSGKVYLTIKVNGISGDCALKLYSFASQVISDADSDVIKPNFVADGRGIIFAEINNYVTIPYPKVFDVIDDNVKVKLKLMNNITKKVAFNDYITEDYQFYATEYGTYQIVYTVYDSANNYRERKTVLNVVDRTAPTIEVVKINESVKVGETVTFPVFVATDNVSEECVTWISVSFGNFQSEYLKDNKFTFDSVGTYTVKYNAVDDAGNYCIVKYTVTCK